MVFNQQAFISSTVLRARHCAGSFAVHEQINHINPSPHTFLREIKHVHKSFNKNAEVTASMGTEKCGYQGGEERESHSD